MEINHSMSQINFGYAHINQKRNEFLCIFGVSPYRSLNFVYSSSLSTFS